MKIYEKIYKKRKSIIKDIIDLMEENTQKNRKDVLNMLRLENDYK